MHYWLLHHLHLSCGSATLAQVVQKHAERFLKEMNCKAIAAELRALGLVPESVESDIHCSKSREEGNAVLLNYLKEDADEETVTEVFRIASEKTSYKKMNTFAAFMLRKLQEGGLYWCILYTQIYVWCKTLSGTLAYIGLSWHGFLNPASKRFSHCHCSAIFLSCHTTFILYHDHFYVPYLSE